MNLHKLRCFAAVADCRSFTQASKKLYISQPSLSRQIALLEQELGFKLFDRSKPQLTLTPEGDAFLIETKEILNVWTHLERRVNHMRMGYSYKRLRVGYCDIIDYNIMAISIRKTIERFPDLGIIPVKKNFGPLVQDLRNGDVDLLFVANIDPASFSDIAYVKIGDSELAVVVNDQHPLAGRESINLYEVANDKLIEMSREESPVSTDYVTALCNKNGFSPNIAFSPLNLESVLLMVSAGLGISIVSPRMKKVPLDNLRYLRINDPAAHMSMGFMRMKERPSPLIDAFIQAAKEVCQTLPPST